MSLSQPPLGDSCNPKPDQPSKEKSYSEALEQRLRSASPEIPVLPEVASQVLAMSSKEDVDATVLSNLIHRDQSLAAQVLRIANSAAFASSERIVSLRQAVARMGLALLREISLSISLKGGIFNVAGFEDHIRSQWRHSLASAAFAKEIARIRRLNLETSFLCGLLHQIGRPLILREIQLLSQELLGELPSEDELESLLCQFETEAGQLVAKEWDLPSAVRRSIHCYSSFRSAQESVNEVAITYLSDRLATIHYDQEATFDELDSDHPAIRHLNLYREDLSDLDQKRESIDQFVEVMS